MAIVVHMRASFSQKLAYGRDEARVFLDELVPEAPDVPIQVAHLAGGGGPADKAAHDALEVLADAVSKGDARTKHLWLDVAGIGLIPQLTAEEAAFFAAKIRQLGVQRVLYGSDAATGGNLPRQGWEAFRRLPLSEEEFGTIAGNVAPYLR
jgi:predicted TIM-barrel fold metal-dependent hydrolase